MSTVLLMRFQLVEVNEVTCACRKTTSTVLHDAIAAGLRSVALPVPVGKLVHSTADGFAAS